MYNIDFTNMFCQHKNLSFDRRYEGKKGVGLEERVARVERKSERGGREEEGSGRPDTRFPMSTGSFYPSLRLILPTTIKNIAAVNNFGTWKKTHLCP